MTGAVLEMDEGLMKEKEGERVPCIEVNIGVSLVHAYESMQSLFSKIENLL